MNQNLIYIRPVEIRRVIQKIKNPLVLAGILANIFRLNALSMIMEAGSGHIGSSFSAMDIVTWLWLEEMRNPNDDSKKTSDIYFSSKGHDAPGLYAVMIGLGHLPEHYMYKLRRLDGLPGHPDIHTPLVPTNTGPLGLGLAKARGMAGAKRMKKQKGRVFVLLGDGELQEGQNWETLQPLANDKYGEIIAIVDHNKIQSDTYVKHVSHLGDLKKKFASFGWDVVRINGHDMFTISRALVKTRKKSNKPRIIIADTRKGSGVSFMEKMGADGMYKFHSGAPSQEHYDAAILELTGKINRALAPEGLSLNTTSRTPVRTPVPQSEKLVTAYGEELVKLARKHPKIVALDADLVLDTGLVPFVRSFPKRHVEAGIAEQYMVSMAGGYALKGMLPIVHSFECFLSTHANAQIYNNATEQTKIIYASSLAGLLPASPGHSHQSVRGISLVGSIPGMTIIEPANEVEAKLALRYAVEGNTESTYIRLVSRPTEIPYVLPKGYRLQRGVGVALTKGADAAIVSYGPSLLREAFLAAQQMRARGTNVAVYNMPWLNAIDRTWFMKTFRKFSHIMVIDDHYIASGLGEQIGSVMAQTEMRARLLVHGLNEIPACGTTDEVLLYHALDADSLSQKLTTFLARK